MQNDRINTDYSNRGERARSSGPARTAAPGSNAQANATQRIADTQSGGRMNAIKKAASGASRRVPGAKMAKAGARRFGPLAAGVGALDSLNTSTEEQAKLLGVEPGNPSPDQSVAQQIGGFAKDTAIRTAGTLYDVGQQAGIVPAIDALPGTNLPRFEGGKYVPGDDVDEYSMGSILSGLNNAYRSVAGFDNSSAQGAATQPASNAPVERAAANTPQAAGPQAAAEPPARSPAVGTYSQAIAAPPGEAAGQVRTTDDGFRYRQSTNEQGTTVLSDAGVEQSAGYGQSAQDAESRRLAEAQRVNDRRQAFIEQQDARQAGMLNQRRQQRMDNEAARLASERSKAIENIKGSIAYRFAGRTPEQRAAHAQAVQSLAALTESPVQRQNAPGADGQQGEQVNPEEQALTREQTRAARIQNDQAAQTQATRQRIASLAQTDPEAAERMAQQFQSVNNPGDRYVKGQQLITTAPDGSPLLEPLTVDVTYDTQTGRQYGGTPGTERGASNNAETGGLSKAEWVSQAARDPRNRGVSRAELEDYYDQIAG